MSNIEQLISACKELLEIDEFRRDVLLLPRDYAMTPIIVAIRSSLPGVEADLRQAQERTAAKDGMPKGWGE